MTSAWLCIAMASDRTTVSASRSGSSPVSSTCLCIHWIASTSSRSE